MRVQVERDLNKCVFFLSPGFSYKSSWNYHFGQKDTAQKQNATDNFRPLKLRFGACLQIVLTSSRLVDLTSLRPAMLSLSFSSSGETFPLAFRLSESSRCPDYVSCELIWWACLVQTLPPRCSREKDGIYERKAAWKWSLCSSCSALIWFINFKYWFAISAITQARNVISERADQRMEMSWMSGSSLMVRDNWKTHKLVLLVNHSEYLFGFMNVWTKSVSACLWHVAKFSSVFCVVLTLPEAVQVRIMSTAGVQPLQLFVQPALPPPPRLCCNQN